MQDLHLHTNKLALKSYHHCYPIRQSHPTHSNRSCQTSDLPKNLKTPNCRRNANWMTRSCQKIRSYRRTLSWLMRPSFAMTRNSETKLNSPKKQNSGTRQNSLKNLS